MAFYGWRAGIALDILGLGVGGRGCEEPICHFAFATEVRERLYPR